MAIFAPAKKEYCSHDSVAQLVEHYTFNVGVLGSNPSGITPLNQKPCKFLQGFFVFKNLL